MNNTISTKQTGRKPVNFFKYSISLGDRFEINNRAKSSSEISDSRLNEDNLKLTKNFFSTKGIIKTKNSLNQSTNFISPKNANNFTSKPWMQDNNISIKFNQSTNDSVTIRTAIEGNNYSSRNNTNSLDKKNTSNVDHTNVRKEKNNSGNEIFNDNILEDQDKSIKYIMNLIDGDFLNEEANYKEENNERNKLFKINNQKNTTSPIPQNEGNVDFHRNKQLIPKYEEDYPRIIKKPKEKSRTSKSNNVGGSSGQDNSGSLNNSKGCGSGNSHTQNDEGNEKSQEEKKSKETQQSGCNPAYNNLNPAIQLDENKINFLKYNLLNKNSAGSPSIMPQPTPQQKFDYNESNTPSDIVNTFTNPKVHNNASSSNSRESSKNSVEAAINSDTNYYIRSIILNKIHSILANSNLAEKLILYSLVSQQPNNSQFWINNNNSLLNIENSCRKRIENRFEKEIVRFTILKFCKFLKSSGYCIIQNNQNYQTNENVFTNKKRERDKNIWITQSKNFHEDKDNIIMDSLNNRNWEDKNNSKKIKIVTCPHKNKKHYAKNMCNACYHKGGRGKNAWLCDHTSKPHYARGKCRNCYLNFYHKEKARKKKERSTSMIVDAEVKDSQLEKT